MPRTPKAKQGQEQETEVVKTYLRAVRDIPEVQLVVGSGRAPDWVRLMTFAALPDDYDEETPIFHRIVEAELAARDCDPSFRIYFDLRRRYSEDARTLEDLIPEEYRVLYQREGVA